MASIWNKIKDYFKNHIELIIAFVISYIIPIALLSEIMSFTEETQAMPPLIKATFMGGIALALLFIVIYKKLKEAVNRMNKGYFRGIFRILQTAIFWGIIFAIVLGLKYFTTTFNDYWLKVGACFLVGHIFYMIDEIKSRRLRLQSQSQIQP